MPGVTLDEGSRPLLKIRPRVNVIWISGLTLNHLVTGSTPLISLHCASYKSPVDTPHCHNGPDLTAGK